MKKEEKNIYNKIEYASVAMSKQNTIECSPRGLKKQDKFLNDIGHSNQKQKLIEQNIKLKTQIFELSRQLEEIMNKEQKKKQSLTSKNAQDDEITKSKKAELKKQQIQVMNLKNKINSIKRQLQSVYNNRSLLAKQDELKHLKQQLQSLQQQKKSLLKIKRDQTKVLKILKSEQQYQLKIQQLKKQLLAVKQQSKFLNQKLIQSQRSLRKNHETYILKQNKLKQIQQKVSDDKKNNKTKPTLSVSSKMINQLQQQIKQLQQQRKQNQKAWNDKLALLDNQLKQKKYEEQKKLIILKQKQKQLRLIQLKIKQYQRLIKHNLSLSAQPIAQDVDMQQFRHKRNIKYMKQ